MNCPICDGDTTVEDTRAAPNNQLRRRRECVNCKHRFSTYERIVDEQSLVVIKANISRIQELLQALKELKVLT